MVRPITFHRARAWISSNHRHLQRPITGWLFGVEILSDDGATIGVAVAGRPVARALQDGVTCEITRVATDGTPNACSFAYGALRRAAAALGYTRIYTYTRADEPGSSPRAAGFVLDGHTAGGEWTTPTRPRRPTEDPTRKVRWVWRRVVERAL